MFKFLRSLQLPADSTMDEVYVLGQYVFDDLYLNIPSRYPPEIRPEVAYPDVEEPYDLNVWVFTGDYKLSLLKSENNS